MAGAGVQSAGLTYAGWGSPKAAPSWGGVILRDTTTGLSADARAIDPVAGDFVLDAYGQMVGMRGVRQMVLLAVEQVLGSSAQKEVGRDFTKLDRITNDFEQRVAKSLRQALLRLTSAGLVEIRDIVTTRLPITGRVTTRLYWRDLTTDTAYEDTFT